MGKIYCFNVENISEEKYQFLYIHASDDRQRKADKIKHIQNKISCIVSDILLKYAISEYFKEKKQSFSMADITVQKNSYGKPSIKNLSDFKYNISHSGNWVVLAKSEKDIGIDIEKIDIAKDIQSIKSICEKFFHPMERDYVLENESQIPFRFIETWSAKESYIKYLGLGIGKMKDSENTLNFKNKNLKSSVFDNQYYLSYFSLDAENEITILTYDSLTEILK